MRGAGSTDTASVGDMSVTRNPCPLHTWRRQTGSAKSRKIYLFVTDNRKYMYVCAYGKYCLSTVHALTNFKVDKLHLKCYSDNSLILIFTDQVSVTTNSVVLIEGCDILPVGKNSVVVSSRQRRSIQYFFLPTHLLI